MLQAFCVAMLSELSELSLNSLKGNLNKGLREKSR